MQSLTAIGLGLRGVGSILSQDREKAQNNLRQLETLVDRSLNELQRLITDLRPSHLDDLGLPAALRWYAGEVQSRIPLQVNVEIVCEPLPLSTTVGTALFRVAQEAVTNVVKHARATLVTVRLEFDADEVQLSVEDNGCGFDPAALGHAGRPSWGLLGMEERASLLGGRMRLCSAPGEGTSVEVAIPYRGEAKIRDDEPLAVG